MRISTLPRKRCGNITDVRVKIDGKTNMLVITYKDKKCPGCKLVTVKYHAKGLCKTCYMRKFRKSFNKRYPVDKVSNSSESVLQ